MSDTMVRMGELAASKAAGASLVTLGLGSCIGLVLLDRRVGVAGLAHIVLPDSTGHDEVNPLKFADRAVPELLRRVVALGARKPLVEAVLVGGASMFAGIGGSMEVGARNEAAVLAALGGLRVRVNAAATGGSRGRTVRVDPGRGIVLVREAGGKDRQLHPPVAPAA
ncbi:MAG TPA: chemotaxis protein CheD [Solirubrobacter sp.]|nr:chemotaxis protein CheD [Solirubrobacter sp.]